MIGCATSVQKMVLSFVPAVLLMALLILSPSTLTQLNGKPSQEDLSVGDYK